jgi:TonB family protein
VVAPDGETKDLAVLSGDPEFSKSALAAIRRWHFRPVSAQGHSVETTYQVHVRFNPLLQEANSDVELKSPQPSSLYPSPATIYGDAPEGPIHHHGEPGLTDPKETYHPDVEFSDKARKAGEQGTVMLSLIVGTDGKPQDVKVMCSSAPDLNPNAIEAVRGWKFEPALKDGKPVMAELAVEVQFHLYSSN